MFANHVYIGIPPLQRRSKDLSRPYFSPFSFPLPNHPPLTHLHRTIRPNRSLLHHHPTNAGIRLHRTPKLCARPAHSGMAGTINAHVRGASGVLGWVDGCKLRIRWSGVGYIGLGKCGVVPAWNDKRAVYSIHFPFSFHKSFLSISFLFTGIHYSMLA